MDESVAALLRAANENAELRAALAAATSVEDTVRVAAAYGFAVTVADLAPVAEDEATDAELESVGGLPTATLWSAPCFCRLL